MASIAKKESGRFKHSVEEVRRDRYDEGYSDGHAVGFHFGVQSQKEKMKPLASDALRRGSSEGGKAMRNLREESLASSSVSAAILSLFEECDS